MKCPKCNLQMSALMCEGVEIDRCPGCAGLWFDAFEHEQLKELGGADTLDSAPGSTPVQQAGATPCPRCRQPMIQMVVAGQPHIAYESCGVCHGVFFDAGEFNDFREETFGEKLRATFGVARSTGG
ncbi:zf-TFIIB domain-containing protein [Lysobacter sp. A3-1-A15]|uniref:zf-TFIIB domain-containing protein n=1 Tax=Novilysobacter viscosus TaxID=3098602 RepID=UPI002EDA3029